MIKEGDFVRFSNAIQNKFPDELDNRGRRGPRYQEHVKKYGVCSAHVIAIMGNEIVVRWTLDGEAWGYLSEDMELV